MDYVETAFYNRVPAWHGKGVVLDHDPSIVEALEKSGLNWLVEEHPIYHINGEPVAIPNFKCLVRNNDHRILGITKENYHVYQNQEAFEWWQPLLDSGDFALEAAGSLKNGSYVWILGRLKTDSEACNAGGKDVIEPYFLITHNHGQGRSIIGKLTPTRVVCWNTLSIALHQKSSLSFNIRHSSQTNAKMDDVRNELQKAIEAFKESMNAYRQLQQKKVSDADCKKFFLNVLQATEQEEEYRSAGRLLSKPSEQEEVMAELLRKQSAERESIGEELVKTPRALAELERIYRHAPGASLARDTAWGAYNAVTYWVDHTRGRDNTRLEQSWIGAGSMIRDRAFDLAMQMT